ncbi:hypothetical protein QR680_006995 [Steinernema hermaphroditum]|uniref:Tyrosine-protein kinase n=1 Tax=Steinernema hermaphroditum TaxID=289476 RepID=A0AA39LXF1_9BILA|nr:hypothetical protein QR680_006995 [Steinernema hermaphroditum]
MENKPQQQHQKQGRLESQEWYMGMLTRYDVEPYLKKEGDFVVRASENNGPLELVLSVRNAFRVCHFTLRWNTERKQWCLACDRMKLFDSVPDLVENYHHHSIPNGDVRLRDPVKRPRWFLKHEHLHYDPVSDKLGSGNFCDVFKGKLHKRRIVAIKLCHPASENLDGDKEKTLQQHKKARDALIQEGNIMAEIQHINIIKFFGICADRPPVMVVMELCPGGSLLEHLLQMKDQISAGERIRYCLETSEGMSYLQDKGYIHRDLAARNCLISKYGIIKIADFGLSKISSAIKGNVQGHSLQIPLRWMAPETLVVTPDFSVKSDVWAFGVLAWEVFSNGKKPWDGWENKRVATHIRRGQMPDFPERTPADFKVVAKECWTLDPVKRCDFKYISKKLAEIQGNHPAPRPSDSTIASIPNVTPLSMDEVQVLQETEEDIALEVVKSTMQFMSNEQIVQCSMLQTVKPDRDPTIEEIVTNNAAAAKKLEEKPKAKTTGTNRKKQKVARTVETRTSAEDDVSIELQESGGAAKGVKLSTLDNKKDKKPKKNGKDSRKVHPGQKKKGTSTDH